MNQSILFNEEFHWSEEQQGVVFSAQQMGQLIECIVSLSYLETLAELQLEGGESALKVFADFRFDLEDLAEELIEAEEFNQQGQVEIK